MTSRERFLKVFRGDIPDRVPTTLFIVDQGHFLSQVFPEVDPYDYETLQLKVIEIQKQFGLDVFVRQLFGLNEPLSIHMGGLDVSQQAEHWDVETEEFHRDKTRIRRSTIKTPDGVLTQEFSIHESRPGTFLYACTEKPIKTRADLDIAIKYEPKMPKGWPQHAKEKVGKLKSALGDDGVLGSWSPHGPFNNASLLIGHEQLYSLFLTDYGFYEQLMNFAMDRILDYAAAIDGAGVDVHCVGGNVAGGFLGKECYDRYILPFEKKYVEFLQQKGTPVMYHNCGQVMALVDSYKMLGAKIIEPFSPPPLGDADLSKVKQMVKGDYVILSGIDQVNVLLNGTTEQVKRATEQTMKIGKPGGRFIMQPVDFIEYGTPVENIEAYAKTALENSYY